MKQAIMRFIVGIILTVFIILPMTGGVSHLVDKSNINTIISEEIDNFSEIYTEEETTTNKIKMITTFEDKLLMVQTKSDKKPSSEKEITEIQVIEEVTTKPQRTTKQTSLVTETTTKKSPAPTTAAPVEDEEADIDVVEEDLSDEEETEAAVEETEEVEEPATEASYYVYSERYPNAAIIWNYLRDLGYNKAVCAGILGNIMAEVGGQTLSIDPYLYDNGYYGICQWSTYYYPQASGMGLYDQLGLLARTIRSEMNNFGYKYYSGFGYSSFLNLTDPSAAAKAFAMCYERCASWSYSVRVNNAYKAYDYFA